MSAGDFEGFRTYSGEK